jgi:cell division protease FtsH
VDMTVEEFGRLFRTFLEQVVHQAPEPESPLAVRLRDHLGAEPLDAPVTGMRLAPFEHPDLQVALDAYARAEGRRTEVIGSTVEHPVDVDVQLTCLSSGMVLVSGGGRAPHVIIVSNQDHGPFETLGVDVLATDAQVGRDVLAELRALMTEHSVYRGKVLTLSAVDGPFRSGGGGASFLPRPAVAREAIVLPAGRLELIERRTVG